MYATTKERVAREVAGVTHYASTTDLWSSVDLKPYISYTIQFITDEMKLRSVSLCTSFLPQDYTGENIADMLEATMQEWNLCPNSKFALPQTAVLISKQQLTS